MSQIAKYLASAQHAKAGAGLAMLKRHGFKPTTAAERTARNKPPKPPGNVVKIGATAEKGYTTLATGAHPRR